LDNTALSCVSPGVCLTPHALAAVNTASSNTSAVIRLDLI
jgi:hypothetical protein